MRAHLFQSENTIRMLTCTTKLDCLLASLNKWNDYIN